MAKLQTVGKALYSCLLNPQGQVLDDLIVYYLDDTHYRMVVNAATRQKDLAWINTQAQAFAVTVQERPDLAMLAVQGPQARVKVEPLLPTSLQAAAMALKPFHACWSEDWFVGRTGYTGEDGFEIILPATQAAAFWQQLLSVNIAPIGLGARDTLRLEAGMNLYGTDMDETCSPLEAGLNWTVAWQPAERDFIGRQALESQLEQANHQLLIGLVLLDKGVLRGHQSVYLEDAGEGYITSGTFSPTLGVSIALARVPAGVYEQVFVKVRDKQLVARVVKPPFVRHGKACIDMDFT